MKKIALLLGLLGTFAYGTGFAAEVPRPAPELIVPLPGGTSVKISDYRGKVVVFAFILTTCPHCQKAVQVLSGIQKDLGPKGFQALSAAINDNPDLPTFMRQFSPAFPVGTADHSAAMGYMQLSTVVRSYMPFLLFIDRNGVIRSQYTGGDPMIANEFGMDKNFRAEIVKLLDEPVKNGKPAKRAKK